MQDFENLLPGNYSPLPAAGTFRVYRTDHELRPLQLLATYTHKDVAITVMHILFDTTQKKGDFMVYHEELDLCDALFSEESKAVRGFV